MGISKDSLAGLRITCAKWLDTRDVAILAATPLKMFCPPARRAFRNQSTNWPWSWHADFDNCDLEQTAKEAARRKRWEFLVTASPAPAPGATGSVLNPIATF